MQGDAKKFYQIFRGSLPIKRTPLLWSTGGPTSFDTLSRVNRQLYCYCNFMFLLGFLPTFSIWNNQSRFQIFSIFAQWLPQVVDFYVHFRLTFSNIICDSTILNCKLKGFRIFSCNENWIITLSFHINISSKVWCRLWCKKRERL